MPPEPRLAQRMADAIAAGQFRPGEWLKQIELASEFNVTRFEVRRALEELALRKAVVHIPQRGYQVVIPTEAEIGHAKSVRVLLESEAIKLAIDHIDDGAIERLRELSNRFKTAVESGSPADRNAANHQFHDATYALAGNPLLLDLIKEVRDRFRGTPIYLWPSVQSMMQSVWDHEEIVRCLSIRDKEAAAKAIRHHILKDKA